MGIAPENKNPEFGAAKPVGRTTGPLKPVGGTTGPLKPVGKTTGPHKPVGGSTGPLKPVGGPASSGSGSHTRPGSSSTTPTGKTPSGAGPTVTRQKPISLSGTNLGSSGSRISLGGVGGSYWACNLCNAPLPKDALVKDLAELRDGKLLCTACAGGAQKKRARAEGQRFSWGLVGGVLAVFAAASLFFPGHILFLVAMSATAAVLVGAIGFNLAGFVRFVLAGCGLLAIVACLYTIVSMRERKETQAQQAEAFKFSEEIDKLLKEDRFNEALVRVKALESKASGGTGKLPDPLASNEATLAQKKMDEWLERRFGKLEGEEKSLIVKLLTGFGETGSDTVKKFKSIDLAGGKFSLTFVIAGADKGKGEEHLLRVLKMVISSILRDLKGVETTEFTVATDEGLADAKVFVLNKKALSDLPMSDPEFLKEFMKK